MAKEKYIAGIDLGTFSFRCVLAKHDLSKESDPAIIGAVSVPAAGMRRGVVVDLDEATSALSQALEKLDRMTGLQVTSALACVGGQHLACMSSKGVIAVSKADGEVSEADIVRVVDAAQAVSIPANREVLHVIPKSFTLDGQDGIKDPLGMNGVRLEVDTNIVHASSPMVKNHQRVITQAGVKIQEFVASPLASAQAVLTSRQKELGVVVVDIGAGTTSLCVYEENTLLHTAVIPIGGLHLTNDLAIGLRASIDTAERVKILFGSANVDMPDRHIQVDLSKIDEQEKTVVPKGEVLDILHARLEEIFDRIDKELRAIGKQGQLPAGVVLVGGTSNLPGIVDYAKKRLRLPAQLGELHGLMTIIDQVNDPAFASVCGLVLWSEDAGSPENSGGISGRAKALLESPSVLKLKRWVQSFLP